MDDEECAGGDEMDSDWPSRGGGVQSHSPEEECGWERMNRSGRQDHGCRCEWLGSTVPGTKGRARRHPDTTARRPVCF